MAVAVVRENWDKSVSNVQESRIVDVGQPTVDQLRIFLAVAEEGSFNRAAKKLGRALSVVSYGVAALEAQLWVALFDRQGSRRPELTDAGRALLADARSVADEVDGLIARARSIRQGLETELSRTATLREELERTAIGHVELVPVAAPGHPLAQAGIAPGETRQHLQLVLTDRSPLTEGREFSVFSPRTWRLADLGAKHALLLEGIGWGNMPRHAIAEDVRAGRLVELSLPDAPPVRYPLHALWRKDARPGPASSWLLEALVIRCEASEQP